MATRQQIRAHLKSLIQQHFTATFDYQPAQLYEEDLPCASIYFESGSTERDHDDNADTTARLVVEIHARTSGEPDKELDVLGGAVESEIRSDKSLNGLVDLIERSGFQYDRDSESLDASLSLIFTALYNDED